MVTMLPSTSRAYAVVCPTPLVRAMSCPAASLSIPGRLSLGELDGQLGDLSLQGAAHHLEDQHPRAEPALPPRSRVAATTGAASGVLIAAITGDRPRSRTL